MGGGAGPILVAGDPNKIAMLLFYFPPDNATLYDYGTCFHTHAQVTIPAACALR